MKFTRPEDEQEKSQTSSASRRRFLKGVATATAVGALGANPVNAANSVPNVKVESWCESIFLRNRSDVHTVEVSVSGSNGFSDTITLVPDERYTFQRLEVADYTLDAQTADGSAATVNGSDSQTVSISACNADSVPDLTTELSCRELAFGNGAEATSPPYMGGRVTVTSDSGYKTILDAAPMGEAEIPALPDGDYTATATADDGSTATIDGSESFSFTIPAPCNENEPFNPHIIATVDCGVISLRNVTGDSIDVTVDGPNGYLKAVTVPGGSTTDVTGLTKWYQYTVTATMSDGSTATVNGVPETAIRVPCAGTGGGGGTSEANVDAVSNDCGKISLSNTSTKDDIDVSISGPDEYSNTVSLAAGQSQDVTSLVGGDYTLTAQTTDSSAATVNGANSVTISVAQCPTPNVSAKTDCDVIRLTNESSSMAVDVTVDGPNGYHTVTNLDADETQDLTGLESGDYTLVAQTVNGTDATVNDQEQETLHVSLCVGGTRVPFS